jgi:Predicted transcriptional regulators
MKTKEFADACGVDRRTLFYYDEIGLLKPARVLENGYREYDESQLPRMGAIRLMAASGLSLKEIAVLLGDGTANSAENDPEVVFRTIDHCCERAEKFADEILTGMLYIRKKMIMRDDYEEYHGKSVHCDRDHCSPDCPHFTDEYHSHASVRLFFKDFEELTIEAVRKEYRENMSVNFLTSGYFLSVAENTETMKPEFFFKLSTKEKANSSIPAGRYVCAFYERKIGTSFVLPLLIRNFTEKLAAEGIRHESMVYAHDLPGWIVGRPDTLIYGFASKVKA